jgi:hypothetical protein
MCKPTLCFDCRNIYKCPFHRSFFIGGNGIACFASIDYWEIEETEKGIGVISCPLFERNAITVKQLCEEEGISIRTFFRKRDYYIKKYKKRGIYVYIRKRDKRDFEEARQNKPKSGNSYSESGKIVEEIIREG